MVCAVFMPRKLPLGIWVIPLRLHRSRRCQENPSFEGRVIGGRWTGGPGADRHVCVPLAFGSFNRVQRSWNSAFTRLVISCFEFFGIKNLRSLRSRPDLGRYSKHSWHSFADLCGLDIVSNEFLI